MLTVTRPETVVGMLFDRGFDAHIMIMHICHISTTTKLYKTCTSPLYEACEFLVCNR